jgi:cytochrome c oxidase assembly protein subunit 15
VSSPGRSAAVERWVWIIALMVAAMVVVGGITRLTGSGLSITEWRPITGAVPPLGEAAWREEFAKYQRSPQFEKENFHFDLAAFQRIYWWEWGHRLLGRLIGLVAAIPFFFFWRAGRLEPWLIRRMWLLIGLGAFQGLLGWLMVASGLVDQPRVSHFRLAAHLITALVTFAIAAWTALQIRFGRSRRAAPPELRLLGLAGAALLLQIVWGAFVAGLRAGHLFPTFPKMGATWIPPRALYPEAWWRAAVDNAVLVQFVHRWLGALVVVMMLVAGWRIARRLGLVRWGALLGAAASLQFALGALTVLFFSRDPVAWGAVHQLGAVVLSSAWVLATFFTRHLGAAPDEADQPGHGGAVARRGAPGDADLDPRSPVAGRGGLG